MLSTLTKTESEAANYEFTTLTCIPGRVRSDTLLFLIVHTLSYFPGVIEYKGANIQLLDLPVTISIDLSIFDIIRFIEFA